MNIYALTRSKSFENHLASALGGHRIVRTIRTTRGVGPAAPGEADLVMVHAASFPDSLPSTLARFSGRDDLAIGIASDRPDIREMLPLTAYGIRAYFHSYMADVHYRHMLELLEAGQSWFAPQILDRALALARSRLGAPAPDELLEALTAREQEIARDVAAGLSNAEIAAAHGIKERTVKSHLTHIFRKLEIRSRTALAIKLQGLREVSPTPAA